MPPAAETRRIPVCAYILMIPVLSHINAHLQLPSNFLPSHVAPNTSPSQNQTERCVFNLAIAKNGREGKVDVLWLLCFEEQVRCHPPTDKASAGAKHEMSRSDVEGAAVVPRLLDRVFGGVVEVVPAKTEGKQNIKGGEVSTADPDVLPPNKQQNSKEATPASPPPYPSVFSVVFVVSA